MKNYVNGKFLRGVTILFLVVLGFVTTFSCGDSHKSDSPNNTEGTGYQTPAPTANDNSGQTESGVGERNSNDTVTTTTNYGNNPNSEGEDNQTDLRP